MESTWRKLKQSVRLATVDLSGVAMLSAIRVPIMSRNIAAQDDRTTREIDSIYQDLV